MIAAASPLHIARAAPIDAAVAQLCREGFNRPPMADGDDVDMAVEMNAGAGRRAVTASDDIGAGKGAAVTQRAGRAQIGDLETTRRQAVADQSAAGLVRLARRIDGRDSN